MYRTIALDISDIKLFYYIVRWYFKMGCGINIYHTIIRMTALIRRLCRAVITWQRAFIISDSLNFQELSVHVQ